MQEGWAASELGLAVFTDSEIFGWHKVRRQSRPRRPVGRQTLLTELTPGELVVHVEHGIARYRGMVTLGAEGQATSSDGQREFLLLEYAGGDNLYVPVHRPTEWPATSAPATPARPSRDWAAASGTAPASRVRRAVREIAHELMELYARREHASGFAFPPDTLWQLELESSFPFVETPDQLEAIEVKQDMESPRPMDRLLVGDVGYGKTEVALRAAFKAVGAATGGRAGPDDRAGPAALEDLPRPPGGLSGQGRDALAIPFGRRAARGHPRSGGRLGRHLHRHAPPAAEGRRASRIWAWSSSTRSSASAWRTRSGSSSCRSEVDVLTLTATPIPRTLHMSLIGVRDMSMIETPPEERLPIRTYVTEYDEGLVREAILRELDRGGQVYFVHNRVQSIDTWRPPGCAPGSRGAHRGRPRPDAGGAARAGDARLRRGRYDVLVCTTIIESGLDIPNANTLIVNGADRFGLAQLYQLRGRVGRAAARAYAYLLTPRTRRSPRSPRSGCERSSRRPSSARASRSP